MTATLRSRIEGVSRGMRIVRVTRHELVVTKELFRVGEELHRIEFQVDRKRWTDDQVLYLVGLLEAWCWSVDRASFASVQNIRDRLNRDAVQGWQTGSAWRVLQPAAE